MAGRGLEDHLVDPARAFGRDLAQHIEHLYYRTPLYDLTLRGRHPVKFAHIPKGAWPGNAAEADKLFRGEWRFAGETVSLPNGNPFAQTPPSRAWAERLHSFDWLRHFAASGTDAATRQAVALIQAWLDRCNQWHPLYWRPDILARRIIAWMTHSRMVASTRDLVYHSAVMNSLARQTRHLARTARHAHDGLPRLSCDFGLIYAGVCLPDSRKMLRRGLRLLIRDLDRIVLPDGTMASRSPYDQLYVLRGLVDIKELLIGAGDDVPEKIQHTIDRMGPVLRLFRHGDGKLALFHGSYEDDAAIIDQVLTTAGSSEAPLNSATSGGFQRLAAGDVVLIADTGVPTSGDLSLQAHASIAAFELSAGNERIIVNCGASDELSQWHHISRATAAHSTLIIDNHNAAVIRKNGRMGRRAKRVMVGRDELEDELVLTIEHDGYDRSYGLSHWRGLRLSSDGKRLMGTDMLGGADAENRRGVPFDVRFHLHPQIAARLDENNDAVQLQTASGQIWHFMAEGASLGLEESIYLGVRGTPQRCVQIVLSGRFTPPETEIQWGLIHDDSAAGQLNGKLQKESQGDAHD